MCPINQLPLEILSEIFLRCIPASTQGGGTALHRVPQLLTRVCKRWYTLAHALPALWASLHIRCNSKSTYPRVAAIHTHLQRSSTHPLAFSLHVRRYEYLRYPATPNLNAILALVALNTARERWQHVHITLSAAPPVTIDAITQGPTPLLKTFHCELIEPDERKPASIPLHTLQACPWLESLAWIGFRNTPLHSLGDTVWAHLASLRLEASLSTTDCLTLLRLSPRLSTAELTAIDLPLTHASLPNLAHQTLHTLCAQGSHTTALLNALTLPVLAHLQLDALPFTHTLATGARTGLHAFLARSTPPLLTLTLDNTQLAEPELLRALALVPALHSLSINDDAIGGVRLTAALVRALHPDNEVLCPRLHTLRISGALECPDGACGAMLRARWGEDARANGVAVLRRVHIELRGGAQGADHEAMRVLRQQGMAGVLFSGRYGRNRA